MKEIKTLLNNYRPKEISFIKEYYNSRNGVGKKKLKLINLILNKKCTSNSTASKVIYNKTPDSSLSQLKKRLKEDLLNFYTLFSFEDHSHDEKDNVELKCLLLITQSNILVKRGLIDVGIEMLRKANDLANQYEIYPLCFLTIEKIHSLQAVNPNHNKSEYCKVELKKTTEAISRYTLLKRLSLDNEISKEKLIRTFCHTDNNTESVSLKFLFHKSLTQSFKTQKKFQDAAMSATEMISFIKQKPEVISNRDKVLSFVESANLHLRLNKYRGAEVYAKTALKFTENDIFLKFKAYEVYFLATFYRLNLDECYLIYQEVQKNIDIVSDEVKSKWALYGAYLFFVKNDYKESLKILQKSKFKNTSTSWIFNFRILELMNILELKDYDWATYKVESFRKLVSKHKEREIDKYVWVYQFFRELLNNSYNYKLTLKKMNIDTWKLKEFMHNYEWNPLGYELLRPFSWLIQKTSNLG